MSIISKEKSIHNEGRETFSLKESRGETQQEQEIKPISDRISLKEEEDYKVKESLKNREDILKKNLKAQLNKAEELLVTLRRRTGKIDDLLDKRDKLYKELEEIHQMKEKYEGALEEYQPYKWYQKRDYALLQEEGILNSEEVELAQEIDEKIKEVEKGYQVCVENIEREALDEILAGLKKGEKEIENIIEGRIQMSREELQQYQDSWRDAFSKVEKDILDEIHEIEDQPIVKKKLLELQQKVQKERLERALLEYNKKIEPTIQSIEVKQKRSFENIRIALSEDKESQAVLDELQEIVEKEVALRSKTEFKGKKERQNLLNLERKRKKIEKKLTNILIQKLEKTVVKAFARSEIKGVTPFQVWPGFWKKSKRDYNKDRQLIGKQLKDFVFELKKGGEQQRSLCESLEEKNIRLQIYDRILKNLEQKLWKPFKEIEERQRKLEIPDIEREEKEIETFVKEHPDAVPIYKQIQGKRRLIAAVLIEKVEKDEKGDLLLIIKNLKAAKFSSLPLKEGDIYRITKRREIVAPYQVALILKKWLEKNVKEYKNKSFSSTL